MIRRILAGLAIAGLGVAAHASDLTGVATAIQRAGLHCPAATAVEKVGESALGVEMKVSCRSLDGKSAWAIRALGGQDGTAPRFSVWEANPPQWTKAEPAEFTLKRLKRD